MAAFGGRTGVGARENESLKAGEMNRAFKTALKRGMFRLHKVGDRLGVHVLPVHYYSPVASIAELERTQEVWAKRSSMAGINVDLDEQVATLERMCLAHQDEFRGNDVYRKAQAEGFGPGYGYIEAQALHGVLRSLKPRKVIEVGSGVSTVGMLAALRANEEETGQGFEITCVEPYPSAPLRALSGVTLLAKRVQTVEVDLFETLGAGDLLFIDSSHVVRPGSDVNFLFLEVLPRLRAGTVVHIHDINFPYDYARATLQTFFQWSESSLLQAFLVNNSKARILFCLSMLHYDRPEALRRVFPEYRGQENRGGLKGDKYKPFEHPRDEHFPSSIYIEIL